LDVGCGTGYGSAILAEKGHSFGFDISIEALTYARNTYPDSEFICGSAESMPFADSSMDAITGFEVIEHLIHPEAFLTECRRILKPHGRLYVSSPNPANLANLMQNRLFGTPIPQKNPGLLDHVKEFQYEEMLNILRKNGFQPKESIGQTIHFTSSMIGIGILVRKAFKLTRLEDVLDWIESRSGTKHPKIAGNGVYLAEKTDMPTSE